MFCDGLESIIVKFPIENPMVHAQRRFNSDNRGISLEQWAEVAINHYSIYVEPDQEIEKFNRMVVIDA